MRPAHGFASRAVLIGSSGGDPSRRQIVAAQLEKMRDLLVDRVRWGLDQDNCIVLVDPETDAEVKLALLTAGKGVSRGGLLLVHYVGPVSLDFPDRLMLQLPGRTFDYEEIRYRAKINRGTRRLVILDCREAAVDAGTIADAAAFERGVLMVDTPRAGEPDFTGHVVDMLDRGLPHGPNLIGPQALRSSFPGTSLAIRPNGVADTFALIRNPALFHADRVGQVLITTGRVTRDTSDDAVILILRYDQEAGTLGVVLNRPGTGGGVTPNWPGAVHDPEVVFDGGPVAHEGYIPLALLRDGAEPPPPFRPIGHRLGTLPLTSRPGANVVERFRLFRGYVGWGPGELEADIASNTVVLGEIDLDLVLTVGPEDLRRLAQERG
nr:YqgE/AlgH family protein [uncultured Actinoplanes sp.]